MYSLPYTINPLHHTDWSWGCHPMLVQHTFVLKQSSIGETPLHYPFWGVTCSSIHSQPTRAVRDPIFTTGQSFSSALARKSWGVSYLLSFLHLMLAQSPTCRNPHSPLKLRKTLQHWTSFLHGKEQLLLSLVGRRHFLSEMWVSLLIFINPLKKKKRDYLMNSGSAAFEIQEISIQLQTLSKPIWSQGKNKNKNRIK